ncbi:hypothetical protein FJ365_02850 [Candidatus Dependentiae bacterium]|nr:hypothetical protein [Candidatus Dependentiae bacterium]
MKICAVKYYVFFSLCVLTAIGTVTAKSNWTMLVFVQANNNLSSFAMQNFNDMAMVGSTPNLTTVVQWYQPDKPGIWRYKIELGRMVLDECIAVDPTQSDGTTTNELVDAMRWAVNKYPANQYSLVLWNHGIGILDPIWGKMRPWQVHQPRLGFAQEIIRDNPRIQLAGLTTDEPLLTESITENTATATCSLLDYVISDTRGILFNEQSRRYMHNAGLLSALNTIKTDVLKNNKLDLLGMDACLMAMLEVGYLAKDAAKVLVASQEVELARGWNWLEVVTMMNMPNATPMSIGEGIVSSFEKLYCNRIPFYTQSAINLEGMNQIRESIDTVITLYNECKALDKKSMLDLVRKARRTCQQFSSPHYVDLHSFLTDMQLNLQALPKTHAVNRSQGLVALQNAISLCKNHLESNIIANVAGKNLVRARGLSIYFPTNRMDESYPLTNFAQESQWHNFIKDFIKG